MGENKNNNKPCTCGSGLKFKKCCKNKKPRNTTLTFMMDEPTVVNGLTMGSDGTVALMTNGKDVKPKSISLGRHYKSDSGKERVVCAVPTSESKINSIDRTILDYDFVFAVDTNTKKMKSDKHDIISIGCVMEAECKSIDDGNIEIYTLYRTSFLSSEKYDKPENEVWHQAIMFMKKYIGEDVYSKKIALVVDSDLANLYSYNNQEKPFIKDVFLPPNITLIHASSDKGADNIYNRLIIDSDKISNIYFQYLEDGYAYNKFEDKLNELIG